MHVVCVNWKESKEKVKEAIVPVLLLRNTKIHCKEDPQPNRYEYNTNDQLSQNGRKDLSAGSSGELPQDDKGKENQCSTRRYQNLVHTSQRGKITRRWTICRALHSPGLKLNIWMKVPLPRSLRT